MRKMLLIVAFFALAAMTFFLSSCLPGGWGGPGPGTGFGGMGGGGGMMGQGGGGMGGGMMSGGNGMMGQGGGGDMMGSGPGDSGGMLGGQGGPDQTRRGTPTQAITIDQAVGLAQKYAASLGNPDIVLTEVEEYTNNFYALYKEKKTSVHAFEMLIDKYNGRIYPESGPNLMWNTKYSPATTTMGTGGPVTPMLMTMEQAQSFAQSFLSAQLPGVTYGDADAFYGYYTLEVKRGGKTFGMLSVNGYSGQVWYHTWHGDFIQEKEVNS